MVAARAGLSEFPIGDCGAAEAFWVAFDPGKQSGPRCMEVLFFVAPGNGEHLWQCLELTCGVTVAFRGREARMHAIIERCCGLDVHQETVVACLLIGAAGAQGSAHVSDSKARFSEIGWA